MTAQERAAEALGAHVVAVNTRAVDPVDSCSCGWLPVTPSPRMGWGQFVDHQMQMLADAGLLAESAPVAGGNGAVGAEPCPPRPTTHTTPDGAIDARLVAQRAATDAWKARAEELGERLDEANAKIERMEAL